MKHLNEKTTERRMRIIDAIMNTYGEITRKELVELGFNETDVQNDLYRLSCKNILKRVDHSTYSLGAEAGDYVNFVSGLYKDTNLPNSELRAPFTWSKSGKVIRRSVQTPVATMEEVKAMDETVTVEVTKENMAKLENMATNFGMGINTMLEKLLNMVDGMYKLFK